MIAALRDMGKHIVLVTGDLKKPADFVGQSLGLSSEQIFSTHSPEQKHSLIQSHTHTMMVGDGINDAVALAAADVGVSVQGSMQQSLAASDIYITQGGTAGLPHLFRIAEKTFGTIKRNLGFSIVYNLAFGVAALLGYVNPLVAAVLMPASSVTILASTLLSFSRLNTKQKAPQTPQQFAFNTTTAAEVAP